MRFHLLLALTLVLHQSQSLCSAYPPTYSADEPPAEADDSGGGGATQPFLATHPVKSNRSPTSTSSSAQWSSSSSSAAAAAATAITSASEDDPESSSSSLSSPRRTPMTTTTTLLTNSSSSAASASRMQPHFVYEAVVPQQEEQHSTSAGAVSNGSDRDGELSKKIIGSSVVTSVSVILNGDEPEFRDAVGHKVPKPEPSLQVASPINLLNPDRYEFFTFDDNGELVKRLMTMQEIQSIVANGDGEGPSIIHTSPIIERDPEKNVQDIVNSVQTVLNKQVESNKNTTTDAIPMLDTPDVSSSWSMILPAIFGNTGGDIFPQQKPQQMFMTPESELLDTSTQKPPRSTKKPKPPKRKPGQKRKTTTIAPTTSRITAETPQVVQEELDPHESVYTGIQQYQNIASNLQGFEAFSNINHQPIYQQNPIDPESTTRRVFVNNQEIVQSTSNRRPTGTTTTPTTEELSEGKKPTNSQHKHAGLPHRNKNPNNGNRPHTTRRPGTTHNKQKIKKKPTTTTPEPTTTVTTTNEPTTSTTIATIITTTTTAEPPTTATSETIPSTSASSLPSSTQTPVDSTPTKKKKKKPTAHPGEHSSVAGHTTAAGKPPHITAEKRKPTPQPEAHHRPRPTHTTLQQPNVPHPVHDSVAEFNMHHEEVTQKYQQINHHRKRPRPPKPTTTTTTVATSMATATTTTTTPSPQATAPELIVESFPGFAPTHMQPTSSSAPPTYAPLPAYPVPATYEFKRHPPPSEVGSSNYQKIQSLPSFSKTQPQQQSMQPDEDQNTKLSFDQIMLSLKQDVSQNVEKISEDEQEENGEKPIPEESMIKPVKYDSSEIVDKLEDIPLKTNKLVPTVESFPEVTPLSITSTKEATISSSMNEEKVEMTPVDIITMRPQLLPTTKQPEYITTAMEPLDPQPDFVADKTKMTTRFAETTTKSPIITTTTATKIDSLVEDNNLSQVKIITHNPVETTDKQASEEYDSIAPSKITEEKTEDGKIPPLVIQTQHLYADISDPIVSDLTTTEAVPVVQTSPSILREETSSEVQSESDSAATESTELLSESVTISNMRDDSDRLPVTLQPNVEAILGEEGERTDHPPQVADLKPFLNINVIKPTEKITMNDFQTQAATVASALVDRTNNLPGESQGNINETKDELASLMSDVIQQITNEEQEYKLQVTDTEEEINRLTNFAHLNTSFLLGESNSQQLSTSPLYSETAEQFSVEVATHDPIYGDSTTGEEESDHPELSEDHSSDIYYPQTTIVIPSNEELIKKEEEYLQTIEITTMASMRDEGNMEEVTQRVPVLSHSQIYAQHEKEVTATDSQYMMVSQQSSEIVEGQDSPSQKLSSQFVSNEANSKEENVLKDVSDDSKNPKEKTDLVQSLETEEVTTIKSLINETYTSVVDGRTTEKYDHEVDSMTEVTLSEAITEQLRDTDADATTLNTQTAENFDYQAAVGSSESKVNEDSGMEGAKDADDSISESTKLQHLYAAESYAEDSVKPEEAAGTEKQEVESYIPVRIEEYKPTATEAEPIKVQIQEAEIVTRAPTIITTEISIEVETKKEPQQLTSEIAEESTEIINVSAEIPTDSEIAESAEKITKHDENSVQALDESVTEGTQLFEEPTASPYSEEGYKPAAGPLEVDPYVKLGEMHAKPVVVPQNNNISAETYNQSTLMNPDNRLQLISPLTKPDDQNESMQPILMENNYEAFINGHQGMKPLTNGDGQQISEHEHDEEDEEDQGVPDVKTSSSISPFVITTTTTTTKPTNPRTTRTTSPPLTSSTTKRLITLKPVSYFKQPSFGSFNQAEPQKIYTFTSSVNPPPLPSQHQQQQRPMHRPPSLSNLVHSSTQATRPPVKLEPSPEYSKGLEVSTANLDEDLLQFTQLCNELAFSYWKSITSERISSARSLVISPFALTSMLSMVFLGARGGTSGEMNEVLKLDDMVTFNPHLVFKNVTDSVERATDSDIATAAFVREIFSDRANGKILQFFKEKTHQLYAGHVEEVNFHVVNDIIRRRTNLLIKRHTMGKVLEYLRTNSVWVNGPLATISANLFQTDCSHGSTVDRDGEMFFQVHPSVRQRRLVPIPAVLYKSGFTAGYEPKLDATVVAFGQVDNTVSIVYVMPGHQSSISPADSLDRLEKQLVQTAFSDNAWSDVLTSPMDRPGLEVQLPRFSHRSFVNASLGLQKMGLKGLFQSDFADLRGLTGSSNRDIYLSDMIQINTFSTCGEDKISDHHHVEMYPAPPLRKRNKDVDADDDDEFDSSESIIDFGSLVQDSALGRGFYDDLLDPKFLELPLPLRPRQARVPDTPSRLRFDKPFLYFVRHNPTGLILFMGRFNPRLLP